MAGLTMPFLIPLCALVAGVLIGDCVDSSLWGLMPVAFALCLYLFLLMKGKTPLHSFRLNPFHHIWTALLFCGIGIFASVYHKPSSLNTEQLNAVAGAEGEVTDVKTYASGDVLTLKLISLIGKDGKQTECRNMKILLNTDGLSVRNGDIVIFKGALKPIADNPNYHSEGYVERMKRNGFLYRASVSSENIRISGFNDSFYSRSSAWRDRMEIALEKSSLNRATVDFLIAFLLGDKSFIDRQTQNTFSNAGVAHILALSGMHVAIIMGIFMTLLFPLALVHLHRTRYWMAIAAIWMFAYFTGMAPSTFRACVMATFVVLSITLQRRRNAGNALLASVFIIILLEPSAIYNVGLQLSFLSVACILLFAANMNPVNRHVHPKTYAATSTVLVSLVATIGTWVLVSYYFKRIPLLFLPANILMLPLLPVYMSVALLYTVLLIYGIDSSVLAYLLDSGYSLFVSVMEWVESIGNYTLDFKATLPVVVLWIVGILVLGYAINRRRTTATFIVAGIFLIGSVAAAPLLADNSADSMIFQKKYREIAMVFYEGDKEKQTFFPRNAVSRLSKGGSEIISVDCKGFADSIPHWLDSGERLLDSYGKSYKSNKKKRYLLLSSGMGNLSLKDIPCLEKFDKVILHSSIRKKKENDIIREAKEIGLDKLHSLRLDGPLEVEL